MNCVLCKQGETQPGLNFFTLQRGETLVIFKQVPAEICENCGECYFNEKVTEQLFKQAEAAVKKGAEVEILKFAA